MPFAVILILTLGLASATADETHQHSWILVDLPNKYFHQYMCASCLKVESEDHWEYCTNPGVCGGCGKTVEGDGIIIEKHVHTWKDYTYNETEHWHHCTSCGNEYHRDIHADECTNPDVCIMCGRSVAKDGIVIGLHYHTWEDYTFNETEHWHYCTVCGNEFQREEHSDECDNPGVCAKCGRTEADGIVIKNHHHIWTDYTINETEHWHFCSRCGNEYHRDIHAEECDKPGVCAVCGRTEEDGIKIGMRWHIWDGYSYDETEHWHHCERCGNDYHRAAHWNNCLNSEVCAACGIPFTGKVIHINENPDDYVQYDAENHQFPCENCHETVLEAHDFVDGVCRLCGYKKTETAPAEYKLQNLLYNGKAVTGKVAHTGGTAEGDSLSVRVTFFITGNYYMATVAEVEADGSFIVEGVGPIEYISVLALGEENGQSKTYSSGEIFVQ